jgi:glyceraldehyde 3-phosphate dehydrogenase
MTTRIAINGFGRMGRLALRAGWERHELDWVGINEIACGAEASAHLLAFDSVHGRWQQEVSAGGDAIEIGGRRLPHSGHSAIAEVPWVEWGTDVVLECTGAFRDPAQLSAYFEHGVKKVIVAAPVKTDALNIVMGVNDRLYDPERHHLVTAASCTTNCLAPVVKVIHESFKIDHGVITTIHDVTNTQTMVDRGHKDLRRARSGLNSLIPTSTGSATAIGMIYPELQGKLNGLAVRVPLLNASLTDCVFELARPVTQEDVNAALKEAAEGPLHGILGYEERPLVSADFVNDPRSAIVDALSTMVVDGTQVKVLAWYDNEWGYVNRMVELAAKIGASL